MTVVSSGPPVQDHTMRRGGSSSRTSQCTMPSKPGAGLVRNVNRCPLTAAKSFGISQVARASDEVSAAQTRSGGNG